MSTEIVWRTFIAAAAERVYDAVATTEGRASFWAESAIERDGVIHFVFPDGTECVSRIVEATRPRVFAVEYFGGVARFTITAASETTSEVLLVHEGVPEEERVDVTAGWVSVLMQLKAFVQFGVDLRNHDRARSWPAGYVEN